MKVWAISDLHLAISTPKPMEIFGSAWNNYIERIKTDWQNKVNDDDIVLLAGDFSWAMYLKDAVIDFSFFDNLKGKKFLIRGNHDYWWNSLTKVRDALPKDCFAIQNDSIKIGNIIICGTRGWTIPEQNKPQSADDKKIYEREKIRLEMALQSANKQKQDGDIILCMIHYPPFNSLYANSEFTNLMEKYHVDKCIYGHLHGTHVRSQKIVNKNDIDYYLTSCDQVEMQLVEIL